MKNIISCRFSNICVFCGSSSGKNREFEEAADQLGKVLAEKKIHLVYGGGNIGLMGRVSKAAYDGDSQVLGIIPKALSVGGVTGNTIREVQIVSDMHKRKAKIFSHADAFIALPERFGTLEELFEVNSWAQLKIHQKPIGLLNVSGFYDDLLSFVDHAVENEFISHLARRIIVTAFDVHQLIEQLELYIPQPMVPTVWSEKKIHLVYGGGNIGLMGRVSKAAYDGDSQVLGIIPKALSVGGVTGNTIREVQIVSDMHKRKAKMFSHADAFIALPERFGTLEELFEVNSWAQLKIHQKPIGLLNVSGFYDGLLSFVDHVVENEFISHLARRIIVTAFDVHQLIEQLEVFVPKYDIVTSKLVWSVDEVTSYGYYKYVNKIIFVIIEENQKVKEEMKIRESEYFLYLFVW
ncbi:hypothetical protein ACOSQ2_003669 [Xanthoceras sorbifolium]